MKRSPDSRPPVRTLPPMIVLFLLTPLAGPAAAEKVERLDIVDRAIAYHGGEVLGRSEVRLEMCSKSGCSELRHRVDGGLFDLEAAATVRDAERRVRITNDTVEWWQDGVAQSIDDREQALRDWVMSRIYFTFLPFRLNDAAVYKEDLGLEEWNRRSLHKIKVSFSPGSSTHAQDEYLYWLDPETGRVELFAYSYATSGGGLRFRRAIDHRRIGGVLFFDQENWGVEGPDLSVDLITPDFVDSQMRLVSTIRLDQIQIGGL
jgi:hypothetical protein